MAQSALLEREYRTSVEDDKNTPEAIAHRKRGSEIYSKVFQTKDYSAEDVAAAFSMPSMSATAAPAAEAPAPVFAAAPAVTEAPARRELFTNLEYKDHTLVRTDVKEEAATLAPEAPVYAPAAMPEVAPAYVPETEEDEDLRPTPRTMETLQRSEMYKQQYETELQLNERVGFFASLSSKAKMALAIVAAAFVVAIALVCINTGIINSIKTGLATKQEELRALSEYSAQLENRIEEVTDPAFVDDYAEHELGMTRS